MPRDPIQLRRLLSNEASLLLWAIRSFMGLTGAEESTGIVRTGIDWPRFTQMVRTHRLVGPVLGGLLKMESGRVPESALADLKADHAASSRRSLYLVAQLIEVLRLLDSNGIRAISFKGPVLSIDAWGDPAIRGSGDLDLLVHRADMPAARQLLIDNGFVPIFPTSTQAEVEYLLSLAGRRLKRYVDSHSEHHLMRPEGRINVDLHWDIVLRQFAVPLDMARLWNNCRMVQIAGESIATLGLEDLLLVLCINAAKDSWGHLDRVCDVAALIRRHREINFDSLCAASRKAGAWRMVLVTFLLARELLDVPLPEQISRAIAADPECAFLAARIIENIFTEREPTRLEAAVIQWRTRDQLRSRIRYLICQCYPTVGDWSALPLPQFLGFVHFIIRPVRLLLQSEAKAR
jgi:hypothetical protein